MRSLGLAAFAACALACGGYGAEPESEESLGTAEMPYIALNSPTKQFGTQTGKPNRSCNKTSSGQTCSIPRFKKLQIVRDDTGTWTTSQRVNMQTVTSALAAAHTGWTFSIVSYTAPADPNAVRVFVTNQAVSGTSGSNVDLYRDLVFGGTTQLTEGQGGGLPVGNYQSHASCDLKLDRNKITGKGANSTEDARLFSHAFGNGIVGCMGVGTNDSANDKVSQRPIDLTKFLDAATTGEVCRASYGDLSDTADFSIQTASACGSD
jgi:hypothetical protein